MRIDLEGAPQGNYVTVQDAGVLSAEELATWNEIVGASTHEHLGASMLAGGVRHWGDEVTLALDVRVSPRSQAAASSRPEQVRQLLAGFQRGTQRAREEGAFPATVTEEDFVTPPEGYRAPTREGFQDTTTLTYGGMERVLAGLRKL